CGIDTPSMYSPASDRPRTLLGTGPKSAAGEIRFSPDRRGSPPGVRTVISDRSLTARNRVRLRGLIESSSQLTEGIIDGRTRRTLDGGRRRRRGTSAREKRVRVAATYDGRYAGRP